jgi:hypothetical protein
MVQAERPVSVCGWAECRLQQGRGGDSDAQQEGSGRGCRSRCHTSPAQSCPDSAPAPLSSLPGGRAAHTKQDTDDAPIMQSTWGTSLQFQKIEHHVKQMRAEGRWQSQGFHLKAGLLQQPHALLKGQSQCLWQILQRLHGKLLLNRRQVGRCIE